MTELLVIEDSQDVLSPSRDLGVAVNVLDMPGLNQ